MTMLEKKVDVLIRGFLAKDDTSFNKALADLRQLMGTGEEINRRSRTERIQDLMLKLGVADKLAGHRYIVAALELILDDPDGMRGALYKGVYYSVADRYATTPSRVERGIRHAIESACNRSDPALLERYFGNTMGAFAGKPTNGEFLARLANIIRREEEEEEYA